MARTNTITIITAILFTGCASFYQPTATARLVCEGPRCDQIWQRAQTWLVTNGRYRIQIVNDNIIQTYGPHENIYNDVAYTLTRTKRADGTTLIEIHGTCHSGTFGCIFDPAPPTNKLYYELAAIK